MRNYFTVGLKEEIINEDMHNKTFVNCKIIIEKEVSFTNCLFYKCAIIKYIDGFQTEFIKCGFNSCFFDSENMKMTNCKGLPLLQCPMKGSFIAYKKAYVCISRTYEIVFATPALVGYYQPVIVKLEIPEDALRSSAFSNKCRCSKAKVLSIESFWGGTIYKTANSAYDTSFVYKVGENVEVDDFDINRWNECSKGIHFFMTKEEAMDYGPKKPFGEVIKKFKEQ